MLGVQHDLQEQVAELLGQRRRGAGLERVVDLVGLLEQMLAQGQVGLLAIPWAAVWRSQACRQPGQPVRAGEIGLADERRQVPGRRRLHESGGRQVADGHVGRAEQAMHRVVGGIEGGEHGRGSRRAGVAAGQDRRVERGRARPMRACGSRQRPGRAAVVRGRGGALGQDHQCPARIERAPRERLGARDLAGRSRRVTPKRASRSRSAASIML